MCPKGVQVAGHEQGCVHMREEAQGGGATPGSQGGGGLQPPSSKFKKITVSGTAKVQKIGTKTFGFGIFFRVAEGFFPTFFFFLLARMEPIAAQFDPTAPYA